MGSGLGQSLMNLNHGRVLCTGANKLCIRRIAHVAVALADILALCGSQSCERLQRGCAGEVAYAQGAAVRHEKRPTDSGLQALCAPPRHVAVNGTRDGDNPRAQRPKYGSQRTLVDVPTLLAIARVRARH